MMKKPILKVMVPVSFTGTVEVEIPADVPPERQEALARKVALARVLATTENPDAPEDDACAEYGEQFGLDETTAQRNWDGCKTAGVAGKWSPQEATNDHSAVVERLVDKAESASLKAEDVDELVHELASSVAADMNNGGLDEQIHYLVKGLGAERTERQIDELVEERKTEEE